MIILFIIVVPFISDEIIPFIIVIDVKKTWLFFYNLYTLEFLVITT